MNNKNKTQEHEAGGRAEASLSRRDLLKGVGLTGAALMTAGSSSVIAQAPDTQASPVRIRVTEALDADLCRERGIGCFRVAHSAQRRWHPGST